MGLSVVGIAYDNTKFWIAKAFLKSKSPQVACRLKSAGTYMEGVLAKDVYEFKKKIVGMSYLVSKIMNKELVREWVVLSVW